MPEGFKRVLDQEYCVMNTFNYLHCPLALADYLTVNKLMKEMAKALEIFDNEFIPGSAIAHDVLMKFKEWK